MAGKSDESAEGKIEQPSNEAESEDVSTALDLDVLAGESTDKAPPPLAPPSKGRSVPFDTRARKTIALILLAMLGVIVLASFILLLWALEDARNVADASDNFAVIGSWLNIVFGPVVTLVGSAVGFYFGSQANRAGTSESDGFDPD